jgi:hypothetical protein
MGGGLMQLVAYGAQDIYLTGNPQITFFKVVYRRHTNFSMESIQQTFNGNPNFGSQVSSTISRNGDLVSRMYLQFGPSTMQVTADANTDAATELIGCNIGHTLMKEIECEIGGQRIDRQYSHWLTVWNELTTPNTTRAKGTIAATAAGDGAATNASTGGVAGSEPTSGSTLYDLMSYNHKGVTGVADDGADIGVAVGFNAAPKVATVPLQFWFNRNPGLALPLIALQYHEVKIKITFCDKTDIVAGSVAPGATGFPTDAQLWADYIYLDTDERRRFAQVSHEYLIEQLQVENGKTLTNATVDLNFNHPVKELIFAGTPGTVDGAAAGPATPTLFGTENGKGDQTLQLKLNGHDRFTERNLNYFTRTQIYQHHSGNGGVTVPDSIGVYSFALKPEEHQPSGTCNFSRIDSAQLKGTGTFTTTMNVYAVNYNVLRIMSGMGGLAYSN